MWFSKMMLQEGTNKIRTLSANATSHLFFPLPYFLHDGICLCSYCMCCVEGIMYFPTFVGLTTTIHVYGNNPLCVSVMIMLYTPGHTRTTMYACCRDGNSSSRITSQKRKGKVSRKMGSECYCLSNMIATEHTESGRVVVKYVMTHTNHQPNVMECKHLPLPQSVTHKVRELLASGVQMERVLDGKLQGIDLLVYLANCSACH